MRNLKRTLLCAVAASLSMLAPAAAQEAPPAWWSVTYVTVKPDMDTEFQDLLKNHWLPAVRKSSTPLLSTWRIARFGNSFRYIFASPIEKFADFDGEAPLRKAMPADEYAMMYERLRDCVESVHGYAMRFHAEASYDVATDDPPKLAVMSRVVLKPGAGQAYAALLQEVVPPLQKAGYRGYWSFQTVFGGSGNEWNHLFLIDNFAEIDKGPPLMRILGPEVAGKIDARFDELIVSEEMYIAAFLPEFSHVPGQ